MSWTNVNNSHDRQWSSLTLLNNINYTCIVFVSVYRCCIKYGGNVFYRWYVFCINSTINDELTLMTERSDILSGILKKNIPTCIAWLDSHHNTSQNILAWYFTNEKILAHRLNEIKFRFGDALFLGRIKHMVSKQRFLFLPNITSYARRFELFLTHCQGISELKPAVVINITMLSTGILRTNYGPFKIGFIYSVCKCRYVYTGNC